MKVIGIVGMPGSGKGTFSSVAADLGIPVVVMGDVIRSEVAKAGLAPTDENMGMISRNLRSQYGMAAIAHVCVGLINEKSDPVVLIDGIRGDAEIREFMNQYPGFILVSVEAPLETRFSRLSERGRSDGLKNISELVSRDERECSFGLDRAIQMATVSMNNNGDLEDFRAEVLRFLKGVLENS